MRLLAGTLWLILIAGTNAFAFDLQGHRGARGLAPENTLPAFTRALEIGVTTLETDLAVTRDGVLVLSHDPVFNPDILRSADDAWLKDHTIAIRSLSLAQLKTFDAGRIDPSSSYATRFPNQIAVDRTPIPTLTELFDLASRSGLTPRFNIETKSNPQKPDESPDPETFARLVVDEIRLAGVAARTSIQSFDWRTLIAAKRLAPDVRTVCLTVESATENTVGSANGVPSPWLGGLDPAQYGGSVPKLVKAAGCETWSPLFTDLTAATIDEAHSLGIKVVPWTVNTVSEMATVISLGVDGMITDYPNIANDVLAGHGMQRE